MEGHPIHKIGLGKCALLVSNGDTPLVSVGSGSGYLEKMVSDISGKNITCIDPTIYDKCYFEPKYKDIKDYPKDGKIDMLICNPIPAHRSEFSYDVKAILECIDIIDTLYLFVEPSGSAGSSSLLYWLYSSGFVPIAGEFPFQTNTEKPRDYIEIPKDIFHLNTRISCDVGPFRYDFLILTKQKCDNPLIELTYGERKEDQCIVS